MAILISASASLNGQVLIYDFGNGTSSHIYGESIVFLPVPPCGIARVSVGGGGNGSFHLENPGLPDFGTDTELRCQASQNGNADKFSIYNCDPAAAYYMSFNFRLDNADDGSWFFCSGDGLSYESDASASGSQVFTNLQWKFGAGGTITTKYRNGPTFTNLPAGIFSQGVNYFLELYMNN